jgi:hypothetical protein
VSGFIPMAHVSASRVVISMGTTTRSPPMSTRMDVQMDHFSGLISLQWNVRCTMENLCNSIDIIFELRAFDVFYIFSISETRSISHAEPDSHEEFLKESNLLQLYHIIPPCHTRLELER